MELNGLNVNTREISDIIKYSATAAAAPSPKGKEKDGQGQVDHRSASHLKTKQSGDTKQSSTSSGSPSSDNKPSPDKLLQTYNALQQSV